jgi:hypothetical protein
VRSTDLEEEWNLDADTVEAVAKTAPLYDNSIIKVASYDEHLDIARQLIRAV